MALYGRQIEIPAAAVERLGEPQPDGAGWRFETDAGPLELSCHGGTFRLTFGRPKPRDYGIITVWQGSRPSLERLQGGFVFRSGDAALHLLEGPLRFVLERRGRVVARSADERHFTGRLRQPPFGRTESGWFVALALTSGEPVYGLGEQFGSLDHRGRIIRSRVEDALGVNTGATYKPVPFAWSPYGWGVFVHTTGDVTHALGAAEPSHRTYGLEALDQALDLFLFAAETPAELLEAYTGLTGRAPAPPPWALGVWHSRAYYRDADEVLRTARTLQDRAIPADVITLDGRAWLDTRTRFDFAFDPARHPDPKGFIDQLHAIGLRVCVWE
ncbi:MAG: glycoside hydrolase family 31 protein, partial [Geminicoccaceae bacterium]|nr:glycoside hydrolase family 31 protein [Geminicoccaceae bacterium]